MLFQRFHKQTSNARAHAPAARVVLETPSPYKRYPRFSVTHLPEAALPDVLLAQAIAERTSARAFGAHDVSLDTIATISATSMQERERPEVRNDASRVVRPAPSGGGCYPLELYWVLDRVANIASGIYHYNVRDHALECISDDASSRAVFAGALEQPLVQGAACWAVLTAAWNRATPIYGEYAYRNALIESGHVAQNMLLAAAAANTEACPVMGFINDEVEQALDIENDDENVLYVVAFGTHS